VPCALQGGGDQRVARHHRSFRRLRQARVLVHHAREQFRVEATPVDADAHRLAVATGKFDHGRELIVALGATPDIARVDAELRQCLGAGGMLG
jgi:hypothetical protein